MLRADIDAGMFACIRALIWKWLDFLVTPEGVVGLQPTLPMVVHGRQCPRSRISTELLPGSLIC